MLILVHQYVFQPNFFAYILIVDLIDYLANVLLFDNPLLYLYIKLTSSTICSLFLETFIFFVILVSFITDSELFCGEVFETFGILPEILLPFKSTVASTVFWIAFFMQF